MLRCPGRSLRLEESCGNSVVLVRHGAFCKHFGRQLVTADVNQSVYFSEGSTYRVSHPADCGDRGTVFLVPRRVLCDIIRELDPSIDDHPDRPFPFVTGPCETDVFWRHRELVERLTAGDERPLEPLWADVTALQLMADVLAAAFARLGGPRIRRRSGTAVITPTVPRQSRSTWHTGFRNGLHSTRSPAPCTLLRFISPGFFSTEQVCLSIAI